MKWLGLVVVAGCQFDELQLDAGTDAAVDVAAGDTTIDGPPDLLTCADFQLVQGGTANHRYQLRAIPTTWNALVIDCTQTLGAYLAIPNSEAELSGLFEFAMAPIWLGLTDQPDEGVFEDVRGEPFGDLPIAGNNDQLDCAFTEDGQVVAADACGNSRRAICECEEM